MKIKRDTKKQILDKAAELFCTDGYGVGINRIISESGVAKMTCYKHFPAKSALICAVIEAASAAVVRTLRAIADSEMLQAFQQAERIFDFLSRTVGNPKDIAALIPRAIFELDAAHPGRAVALRCERRVFDEIHNACTKAGCHSLAAAMQIHLMIAGQSLLRPVFGDRVCNDATRAATSFFLPCITSDR